jgi:hypothetical protein
MSSWLVNGLGVACSVIITLIVTLVFNKLAGWPSEIKKQKEAEKAKDEKLKRENRERDVKIASLEDAINALPGYRAQSIQVQNQLQSTDREILAACAAIKQGVADNQRVLNERLDRLEKREKNAIRAKLIDEYRLFTDAVKNPMLAWSEMENHAFFKLVEDYEDLGGNDFVHDTVLPAMHELEVISMDNKTRLLELMNSRRL